MKYITLLLTLLFGVALADANIDLGGKRTRMDEAREWCVEKNDPTLNYYQIADGTRVVFGASSCKLRRR